jgi:general secretion pathway protein E
MTGFSGRVGIYETLVCSAGIKEILMGGADLAKIREQAYREGMKALRISGAMKVAAGTTTIEEVLNNAPPAVDRAAA